MEKEILCTMSPDEITVTRQVAMTFTMMHQGDKDVTFINEGGYKAEDIPDIDSSEMLDGVTYFYFYFTYGDTPEALVDGNEDRIEFQCDSEDWDVVGGDKSNYGYVWKICPRDTIVWKADGQESNSELVIEFPDINCNGAVGTAYAYVREGKEENPLAISIKKYLNPQIKDLKILPDEPDKPYFIGEKGWIGWTIPNHASFNISLDDVPVNQNSDDHKMEVDIKYGDYTLKVTNKIGTCESQNTHFPLDIIKQFSIDNLSASKAVMSWEIEEKNADDWKLKGFSITELKSTETHKEISAETTTDRKFTLMAQPKGSAVWVTDEKAFVMPVIDSFTVTSKKVDKQDRLDCENILMERDLNGFVPLELITADGLDEYATPFCFACKGGGGGGSSTYDHCYIWSGRNVDKYYLTVGGDKKEFDKDTTSYTIRNQDEYGSAVLEAEGQYQYTVRKTT